MREDIKRLVECLQGTGLSLSAVCVDLVIDTDTIDWKEFNSQLFICGSCGRWRGSNELAMLGEDSVSFCLYCVPQDIVDEEEDYGIDCDGVCPEGLTCDECLERNGA